MRLRLVWFLFLASVLLRHHKTLEHLRGSSSRRDNSEAGRFGVFWILCVPPGWSLTPYVQNCCSELLALRSMMRCASLPADVRHSLPFFPFLPWPLPLDIRAGSCEYLQWFPCLHVPVFWNS